MRRWLKHRWQRLTRGWSDDELWSLEWTIAKFILPRLKAFREDTYGYPFFLTEEKWDAILDEMIFSFEAYTDEYHNYLDCSDCFDENNRIPDAEKFQLERAKRHAKVQRGLALFAKYYGDLWQ